MTPEQHISMAILHLEAARARLVEDVPETGLHVTPRTLRRVLTALDALNQIVAEKP